MFSLPETLEQAIHSPEHLGANSQSNVDDEAIYHNETSEQKLIPSEPPQAHRPIS